MSGLSWLAVLITSTLSPRFTSHAQPEPKRVLAASSKLALHASNARDAPSIAAARLPVGLPPLPGARISQNSAGLGAPPPLVGPAGADCGCRHCAVPRR